MSIMNFLPWRQQRRARCLHFWGRNVCRHRAVNVRDHFLPTDKPSYEAARAANGADGNADRAACACLPAETRLTGAEASADPSTTRMATGAGVPFPRHSFTGLADRASLSASCSDAERVCHNPVSPVCSARCAGPNSGFYARNGG